MNILSNYNVVVVHNKVLYKKYVGIVGDGHGRLTPYFFDSVNNALTIISVVFTVTRVSTIVEILKISSKIFSNKNQINCIL